ncbi:hypothetical protein [Dictyobacter arantiisoli]|uniref:Uncharacterized protein n=1 Tax=Dictyobacter arantiisoli TaxID=2014874 RepID=A0A5A5TIE1_9CHLR|nr:hypothetical protein [Dictyobacter arantiisoli]GCF10968.1 hypothetical protein KDI_45320 [Dictyobacter arantiisoli]
MRRSTTLFWMSGLAVVLILALFVGTGTLQGQQASARAAVNSCTLNSPAGNVQHVIYLQFDNVHLTRDNPNIPSDLEQMPNLLNFVKNNGTMLAKNHTPLIAHTGDDILTSLTGVYGERHGVSVSNSYRYYNTDGSTSSTPAFTYWTAPVSATNPTYNMLSAPNTNAPAPWVPYTRAGCNVGSVATANTVLENIGTDIPTVFGANSPEAAEVKVNPAQATSDFVGIGIHCAQNNALCATSTHARADILPDEPGGYTGYQALFGHKYVASQIHPNGPLTDLNGNIIQDNNGHVGFPGFDSMTPAVSLSYVADMQEHGVPVTYAYLSDAHDPHPSTGSAYGPGQAGYVAALKAYDDAFGKFFTRLQADGINAHNTLFVFTADEGDHFVGSAPTPANCDGVTVPCTYNQVGEVNGNLTGLLATQKNITTPFTVHADSAPTIYLTGQPARTAPVTRTFEQALAEITATNPYTGKTEKITHSLADPVEMQLLHMVTADPTRTPTLTLFAKPDYYLYAGAPNCIQPCIQAESAFAWNHGDVSPDINTTWLGLVGPGIQNQQLNTTTWADHADIRPTMLALLGLKDDYVHDGRVLFEVITHQALPPAVRANRAFYEQIAQLYKQINAPVGKLGLSSLEISTRALQSHSANDQTYTTLENQLQLITTHRNTLAKQMITVLENAAFGTANPVATIANPNHQQAQSLFNQGQQLLKQAQKLAAN